MPRKAKTNGETKLHWTQTAAGRAKQRRNMKRINKMRALKLEQKAERKTQLAVRKAAVSKVEAERRIAMSIRESMGTDYGRGYVQALLDVEDQL